MTHPTLEELHAGLDEIRSAPKDVGRVELIVSRPEIGGRVVLEEGRLDVAAGLVGDNWATRGSSKTPDKSAHPEMQLNLMGRRAIALIAQSPDRWPLAGDQLFVDLDLSLENLPAGTELAMGSAVIEVTPMPHRGCHKFIERFGIDAHKFVNSPVGAELNLRGINAKVITPGSVRAGDAITVRRAGGL
jgi:hypothetical protein